MKFFTLCILTAKHVKEHPLLQFILQASPHPLEHVTPHMLAHVVHASLHPIHAFLHVFIHLSTQSLIQDPVQE